MHETVRIWMLDKPNASALRQTIKKIIHLVSSHCCRCTDSSTTYVLTESERYCNTANLCRWHTSRTDGCRCHVPLIQWPCSCRHSGSHWTVQTAVVTTRDVRFVSCSEPPYHEHAFCLPFSVILITNSDYFSKRYLFIYLCNGDRLREVTKFLDVIWNFCRLQILNCLILLVSYIN